MRSRRCYVNCSIPHLNIKSATSLWRCPLPRKLFHWEAIWYFLQRSALILMPAQSRGSTTEGTTANSCVKIHFVLMWGGLGAGFRKYSTVSATYLHDITVCQPLLDDALCSVGSLWPRAALLSGTVNCTFSLMLNQSTVVLPSMPGSVECGNGPQVIFSVQEDPQHVCYSNFTVVVVICSASESVVGEFNIVELLLEEAQLLCSRPKSSGNAA